MASHEALDVPVGDVLDDDEPSDGVGELVLLRGQVVDRAPILPVITVDVVELEDIDVLTSLLLLLLDWLFAMLFFELGLHAGS